MSGFGVVRDDASTSGGSVGVHHYYGRRKAALELSQLILILILSFGTGVIVWACRCMDL